MSGRCVIEDMVPHRSADACPPLLPDAFGLRNASVKPCIFRVCLDCVFYSVSVDGVTVSVSFVSAA